MKKGAIHKILNRNNLIFCRHGLTSWDDGGIDKIAGWMPIPLNEEGEEQAYDLAQRLRDRDVHGIFSSDIERAVETAQILREHTGFPILGYAPELRAWDAGVLTGKESDEHKEEIQRLRMHEDEKVKDGESFKELRERFLSFIKWLDKEFLSKHKKIIIVSHSRNDLILEGWFLKGCPDSYEIDKKVLGLPSIAPATYKEYTL